MLRVQIIFAADKQSASHTWNISPSTNTVTSTHTIRNAVSKNYSICFFPDMLFFLVNVQFEFYFLHYKPIFANDYMQQITNIFDLQRLCLLVLQHGVFVSTKKLFIRKGRGRWTCIIICYINTTMHVKNLSPACNSTDVCLCLPGYLYVWYYHTQPVVEIPRNSAETYFLVRRSSR
jgi:hypothetical protein